jgi:hypothetical protein
LPSRVVFRSWRKGLPIDGALDLDQIIVSRFASPSPRQLNEAMNAQGSPVVCLIAIGRARLLTPKAATNSN